MVCGLFPTHPNREVFEGLQGIILSDQGNYPSYQGIRFPEPFWMISGALKGHFSPILAGKSLLSRRDYLAISHSKALKTGLFCPPFAKPPVQFTVYKKEPTRSSRL
jgi:hypothetical protein